MRELTIYEFINNEFKNNSYFCWFMCTVFLRHHLGRRRCGPERFRYHGKKSTVVDYRIGAVYRVYHLSDIWI